MRKIDTLKLASAGIAMTLAACSSSAAPPLTPAIVKDVFAKVQPTCVFTWKNIQIAPARKASIGEITSVGMPPNAIVTPVRVEYSSKCGYIRDYRWNYYFFKDDFGGWTKQSNAMPGNFESEPR